MVKKLITLGNLYAKESDWKDFALVKCCLFSAGLIAGMFVPEPKRKLVFLTAFSLFMATYMPLMVKFFELVIRECRSDSGDHT